MDIPDARADAVPVSAEVDQSPKDDGFALNQFHIVVVEVLSSYRDEMGRNIRVRIPSWTQGIRHNLGPFAGDDLEKIMPEIPDGGIRFCRVGR